jgi:hypothetical protein
MAGARAIKLATARIRREQEERNREALIEAEKRRTEAEEISGLTPSDRRRRENLLRQDYKQGQGPSEDKMARSGVTITETKGPLARVPFAPGSPASDEAKAAGLAEHDFIGRRPSGQKGFTAADVRAIIADKAKAEEEAKAKAEEEATGNQESTSEGQTTDAVIPDNGNTQGADASTSPADARVVGPETTAG